ncbi:MAG: hypothetical protein E6J91_31145 [Deltaproteobacteria bacterium]|nr:MAG: hypothetical protein E6J91_31145 [Deltaproteobacteria bacterium]
MVRGAGAGGEAGSGGAAGCAITAPPENVHAEASATSARPAQCMFSPSLPHPLGHARSTACTSNAGDGSGTIGSAVELCCGSGAVTTASRGGADDRYASAHAARPARRYRRRAARRVAVPRAESAAGDRRDRGGHQKFGGSTLVARASGLGWRESMALGVLMNTRGLMELVVLNIGLDLKLVSPTLFAMFVTMALVTTLATTPILHLLRLEAPRCQEPAPAGSRNRRS